MKRVLMTGDPIGGVFVYALELARELGRHDVEVLLAIMGAPLSEAQRAEAAKIGSLRIAGTTFKLEWMEDPFHEVSLAGEWLLDLEADYRPDVVHLNGYSHGVLPFSAPKIAP